MTKSSYILLLFALPLVHPQGNNLTICNTETIATKTVFEFWHQATDDCELDTSNLFEMRQKLLENHNNDQINELLSNHVSSSLMGVLFNQIMATISTKSSIRSKPDFQKIINTLYAEDKTFIMKIWQQALTESILFMDIQNIIQHILLIEENNELKLDLFDYLLNKYKGQHTNDQRLMPLLVYGITSMEKEIAFEDNTKNTKFNNNLLKILQKLPEPLLVLYQHWAHNITLLNKQYNDYIYAERNIGPADNKRYIFTFMPNQNKYKSKGYFKVQLNAKGMLAIGAYYGPSYKYIAAEDHSAFMCLDSPSEGSQWWQVLWPLGNDEELVAFQNTATEELLCATGQYNEKLILISMLATDKHRNNPACQWKVFKRIKNHSI